MRFKDISDFFKPSSKKYSSFLHKSKPIQTKDFTNSTTYDETVYSTTSLEQFQDLASKSGGFDKVLNHGFIHQKSELETNSTKRDPTIKFTLTPPIAQLNAKELSEK